MRRLWESALDSSSAFAAGQDQSDRRVIWVAGASQQASKARPSLLLLPFRFLRIVRVSSWLSLSPITQARAQPLPLFGCKRSLAQERNKSCRHHCSWRAQSRSPGDLHSSRSSPSSQSSYPIFDRIRSSESPTIGSDIALQTTSSVVARLASCR